MVLLYERVKELTIPAPSGDDDNFTIKSQFLKVTTRATIKKMITNQCSTSSFSIHQLIYREQIGVAGGGTEKEDDQESTVSKSSNLLVGEEDMKEDEKDGQVDQPMVE